MRIFSVEVVSLEFDRGAPKRATNLRFNSDLLRRAKALGIILEPLARSLARAREGIDAVASA
ncbi:type II toxin-antitoxin system CcdA family antitoxin [Myxococcota bacterium]|nr:type II toxin-antitoxin system CcdA family antitoxin [Myxococcota bacterium]